MSHPLRPNEKIVQLLEWKGNLLGLSSEGRIFHAMISGDLRHEELYTWHLIIDCLKEKYKDRT